MTLSGSNVELPPDSPELNITRAFAAPRRLVWQCYTRPQHLVHFWSPKGATVSRSEVDLRVGGVWTQGMRFASGNEYSYASVYLEVVEPERLMWRDAPLGTNFGDELPPLTMLSTLTLGETAGGTLVTVNVRFNSIAERDTAAKQGFATTVTDGHDKFAEYLKTLIAAEIRE